jgi:hypothetical protein
VHTPDLFDGRTFDTLEEGMGYTKEIGFGEVMERGVRAVGWAAHRTGLRRLLARCGPGPTSGADAPRCARGAPLLFLPPVSEFGSAWPVGVPVQVHGMDADPIFAGEGDIDAGRALVEETDDAELFLYPGDQHLLRMTRTPPHS